MNLISLTDKEASKIDAGLWTVKDISPIKGENGKTIGFSGTVFGINVFSDITEDNGKISSNNLWQSRDYKKKKDKEDEDEN